MYTIGYIYLSMVLEICNHYSLAHSRDLRSVRLSLCQDALLEEMGVAMLPKQPRPLVVTCQQIFPLLKYSFQRLEPEMNKLYAKTKIIYAHLIKIN